MILSKATYDRIRALPEVERPEAMQRAHNAMVKKSIETQAKNLSSRIRGQIAIREQARAIGAMDKARAAQVQVRYLRRKLAALRARRT